MCITKESELLIRGGQIGTVRQQLVVELALCQEDDSIGKSCKSTDEIKNWLNGKHLVMLAN